MISLMGTTSRLKLRLTVGTSLCSVTHEGGFPARPGPLTSKGKGHIFPFMSFHGLFFHSGFTLPVWLQSSVIGQ